MQHPIEDFANWKVNLLDRGPYFQEYIFPDELLVKVSYVVPEIIAKISKPYLDNEFVKECFLRVTDVTRRKHSLLK